MQILLLVLVTTLLCKIEILSSQMKVLSIFLIRHMYTFINVPILVHNLKRFNVEPEDVVGNEFTVYSNMCQ